MENLNHQKETRHEIEGNPYYEETHRKNLEFMKKLIEHDLGIELTNTELIKLSFIIEDIIRQMRRQAKEVETGFSTIAGFEEVTEKFLRECYGVTYEEIARLFPRSENEEEDEKNKELKKKYFRRKQAELYN
ncbi:MAG: hypothetical protein AAB837_00695 [Patescibacteria group bacterium]